MTDTCACEAPAPDRAYAKAPDLRGEFTRLMALTPDALAGRLAGAQLRAYLLCRAAVKDRTALIAVLSEADRDFAKAAAEEAEAAAEALWNHDAQHTAGHGPGPRSARTDAAGESLRPYVRRHYLNWVST
ncbi:hypothetical protein [Streptacidiphilus sp. PAMC 29251]|jgi:hypothetical protein